MPHSLRQGETVPVWVLGFPDGEPTPLLNPPDIHAYPDKPVVMVEGEKAAEAAGVIFGDAAVVTTHSNGGSAWRKADLGPLAGRRFCYGQTTTTLARRGGSRESPSGAQL